MDELLGAVLTQRLEADIAQRPRAQERFACTVREWNEMQSVAWDCIAPIVFDSDRNRLCGVRIEREAHAVAYLQRAASEEAEPISRGKKHASFD